jgi:four helix bundle protein
MAAEEYTYAFEKLDVWQLARILNKDIYDVTSLFPVDEKFGLITQLRRASISISSNIAEGSTRFHKNDQCRFYQIAFGSAIEVLNQCILANDLQLLDYEKLVNIRKMINQITFKLGGLIRSLDYKSKIYPEP